MQRQARAIAISISLFGLAFLCGAGPGTTTTPPRVSVLPSPAGCHPVIARIDPQGTIHLASNSDEGPQYAKSTDGGQTFSRSIRIVDQASLKPGLVFEVWDMAVSSSGDVHVALGTNAWKLKLPKSEWGFFYARLVPGTTSFTPVRNLNQIPSEGFSLAVNNTGTVTACWMADKMYANISFDRGETFSPTLEIDQKLNPCNCCTTIATYGVDGKLAVLYREETDNERDMFLALWDQSGSKVTRTRISSTLWKINSCPMTYYGISATENGYMAAWPTEGKVYFTRLNRAGKILPPGEIKTPGIAGMRHGILALNGASDTTLVAWKKDRQLGWQVYDRQGKPIGQTGSATSEGKGTAGVVDSHGNFVLFR